MVRTKRWSRAGLLLATLLVLGLAPAARPAFAARDQGGTPWLGVMTQELTAPLKEGLQFEGRGVLVSRVVEGSPADRAGIEKGDVITRVNSRGVESPEDLARLVQDGHAGQQVRLEIVRDGKNQSITATLDTRPGEGETPPAMDRNRGDRDQDEDRYNAGDKDKDQDGDENDHDDMDVPPVPNMEHMMEHMPMVMAGRGRLGVRVEDLSSDDRGRDRASHGARITSVVPGSPAERAGLRPGDVITRVNDQSIDDSGDLVRTVQGAERRVRITFERRGSSRTVDAQLDEASNTRVRRFDLNRDDLPGSGNDGGRVIIRRDMSGSDSEALRREIRDLRRQVDELRQKVEELSRR